MSRAGPERGPPLKRKTVQGIILKNDRHTHQIMFFDIGYWLYSSLGLIITTAPSVKLIIATEHDFKRIENMMQFYMHDFSEWLPISLNENGLFSTRPQFEYFSKLTTKFYVITVDGETAGFVSVDDEVNYPDTNHNIGYLFIARGFRRKGIAKSVVNELLARFSGGWQIFHITENLGAAVF
jgi:predicted acetyltransferase